MLKDPQRIPLKLNEIRFNESYTLAVFKDVASLNTALSDPANKAKVPLMGDRFTIIAKAPKFRPKGEHKDDSINIMNLITAATVKMNCRYDDIKYACLIRK